MHDLRFIRVLAALVDAFVGKPRELGGAFNWCHVMMHGLVGADVAMTCRGLRFSDSLPRCQTHLDWQLIPMSLR